MTNFRFAFIFSLLALGGCVSMAPHYERPSAPVPGNFANKPTGSAIQAPLPADTDWRSVFTDAKLQEVIALALENNRDLRVAMLNIDKARTTYRIQQADLFPSIKATGSNNRSGTVSGAGVAQTASASVGFTSWEIDLFGRIRSLSNEALETFFATEQTQRSSRASLVAETAGDWLTVAAYRQQLKFAQDTYTSQAKTLTITEAKYKEGLLSALDYESVKTSVDSALADIASYKKSLAAAENALNLVVGATVPQNLLPDDKTAFDALKTAPVPADLPSTVLLNHPDVLYAEHTLKAANADIGAARAAFFPTISLTGSIGSSSSALSDLFTGGTRIWSFTPSISLPIFNAGELKTTLDAAKIQKNIYIAQYEKAIQSAFADAANALSAQEFLNEQLKAQNDLVRSAQRTFKLTTARYNEGIDDYLTVLTAQRTYYSAYQDLISLQLEESTNRATLYKVLGGGADAQPRKNAGTKP